MQTIIGEEKIKDFLLDFLNKNENGSLKSIITGKPLVYYFGEDFAEKFMQERVKKNIFLQSLRLTPKNFDTQKHKDYAGYLKEAQHHDAENESNFDTIFLCGEQSMSFDVSTMSCKIFDREEDENREHYKLFDRYWKD